MSNIQEVDADIVNALILTDLLMNNSEEEGHGDLVTIVDCSAVWCGPCKRMLPVLEQLADDNLFPHQIVKIDIDKNRAFAQKNEVRSVPNFIVYSNGTKVGSFSGARGKDDFVAEVNRVLDDA